jgi:GNAT superfamily N-acetyltransferase
MSFRIRPMDAGDVAAGLQLVESAGWNQTRSDWERFLVMSAGGCFVAEIDSQVVGTVATISYEDRFAWIGMVLVDPACRGKGIGGGLLKQALDYLGGRNLPCVKLDATPRGKPLYEKLGFSLEYELERWELTRPTTNATAGIPAPLHAELLTLDREVFGADRSPLLRSVASEFPEFVLEARRAGNLSGYSFGRRGALADHLGPWVARDQSCARELLNGFLRRAGSNRVFADALKQNDWSVRLLREQGFRYSRTLTRMYRGRNAFPGRPELQGAILGPEFG